MTDKWKNYKEERPPAGVVLAIKNHQGKVERGQISDCMSTWDDIDYLTILKYDEPLANPLVDPKGYIAYWMLAEENIINNRFEILDL
jgi:hypothetical protein